MKIIYILFLLFVRMYGLEKDYQEVFCNEFGGIMEYRLHDKKRVDCLTKEYAIEVDFAHKYHEAISQSLEYALDTKHKAGILLILKNEHKDKKYINRLYKVMNYYKLNIQVWTIDNEYTIKRLVPM